MGIARWELRRGSANRASWPNGPARASRARRWARWERLDDERSRGPEMARHRRRSRWSPVVAVAYAAVATELLGLALLVLLGVLR